MVDNWHIIRKPNFIAYPIDELLRINTDSFLKGNIFMTHEFFLSSINLLYGHLVEDFELLLKKENNILWYRAKMIINKRFGEPKCNYIDDPVVLNKGWCKLSGERCVDDFDKECPYILE